MTMRYPLSKLLVFFGVRAFADKLAKDKGRLVVINTPNPSWCKSQLMRESSSAALRFGERILARSTEEGSRTLVHSILSGEESNGQYLNNCQVTR